MRHFGVFGVEQAAGNIPFQAEARAPSSQWPCIPARGPTAPAIPTYYERRLERRRERL